MRRLKSKPVERVPVALPARFARALLIVSEVRNEITFRERLAIVRAANVLIAHGVSQNRSADALDVSRSRLCIWRQLFAQSGPEALRPAQSATSFLELLTRRR